MRTEALAAEYDASLFEAAETAVVKPINCSGNGWCHGQNTIQRCTEGAVVPAK